jgi:hypothetical protein
MTQRVNILLTFSADLDRVPGWGYDPKDWVELVERELLKNSHYNTDVDVRSVWITKND